MIIIKVYLSAILQTEQTFGEESVTSVRGIVASLKSEGYSVQVSFILPEWFIQDLFGDRQPSILELEDAESQFRLLYL